MISIINFIKNRPIDLITIGRAGVDFYPSKHGKKLKDTMHFSKYVGGTPANVAVGISRLKKKAGILTRVSSDDLGKFVLEYLNKENINTELSQVDKKRLNSLAITEVEKPSDCGVIMYRSNPADLALSFDEIDLDKLKNSKAILITGTALSENPSRNTVIKIADFALENDIKIFFDLDYRPYNWESDLKLSNIYLEIALKSDVLIGNVEEYEVLNNGKFNKDELAKKFLNNGVKIVIIKAGDKGSETYYNNEKLYQKVFKTKLKKTYGAGDAFASGFIYGMLENLSVKESLEIGSAAAAIVVEKDTCTEAMPDIYEIKNKIKEG